MHYVISNQIRRNIGCKRASSNKNGVNITKGRDYVGYKYNNNKGKNRIYVNKCTVYQPYLMLQKQGK